MLDLRESIDGLVEEVLPDRNGGWRWRVLRDDQALAVASRAFARRVECEGTLAQFRKVAGSAPAVPRLQTFH